MARRRDGGVLGDLFDLCALVPWWVGVLLAAGTYLALHFYASAPIPAPLPGQPVLSQHVFLKPLASVFQYVLPLVMLAGAVASAFTRRKRNRGFLPDVPACPFCERAMVIRTARRGKNAGSQFWGCPSYPECKGLREI